MTRPILVPLDGSCLAEEALPLAIDLALRWREPLHLAGVHRIPAFLFTPESGIGSFPTLDREMRLYLENYLRTIADRLAGRPGLEIVQVVLEGDVVDALAHHANTSDARVVVMTTHGRGGASRVFLGSVADGLVRHVSCPVLLATPGAVTGRKHSPATPQRVVVPLDGTPLSESIIDRVLALCPARNVVLDLVAVVSLPQLAAPPAGFAARPALIEAELTAARRYLDSVAVRLAVVGVTVETKVLMDEQVFHAIVGHARARDADFIAIATRGRAGARRALFGSVADKVVRSAGRPVLVWNPMPDASSRLLTLAAVEEDATPVAAGAGGGSRVSS